MTSQPTVVQANGSVTIHSSPDSIVCVVGQDGVVTSVLARPGELTVNMEKEGREIWRHTFTYTFPATAEDAGTTDPPTATADNNHSEPIRLDSQPTRRPRGRPRMRQSSTPQTFDDL